MTNQSSDRFRYATMTVKYPQWIVDDGYAPVRVDVPKPGEYYLRGEGDAVCRNPSQGSTKSGDCLRGIRLIVNPVAFEQNGYYKNASGRICGPLKKVYLERTYWVWEDQNGVQYYQTGEVISDPNGPYRLLPRKLVAWKPMSSLAAGVYFWDGDVLFYVEETESGLLFCDRKPIVNKSNAKAWNDWETPPSEGYYRVEKSGVLALLWTDDSQSSAVKEEGDSSSGS